MKIEGIDIEGMANEAGWSDTTEVAGGEASGESVDGRGEASVLVSSALGPSFLLSRAASMAGSDTLESMLVLPVSAATPGLRTAGLSGREGRSDEALDSGLSTVPLVTAFASRSCNREFGLLRDAFRGRPELVVSLISQQPRVLSRISSKCENVCPPASTDNFCVSPVSPAACLAAVSAALAFALAWSSSASMVSSRDSRPATAPESSEPHRLLIAELVVVFLPWVEVELSVSVELC